MVFESPNYGTQLEHFDVIPMGRKQDGESYSRFFEGTGKGFKNGGSVVKELTPKEIEWYKSKGFTVEEID